MRPIKDCSSCLYFGVVNVQTIDISWQLSTTRTKSPHWTTRGEQRGILRIIEQLGNSIATCIHKKTFALH